MRGVGLEVRRVDRQRRHVAQRPDRAAGHGAEPVSVGLVAGTCAASASRKWKTACRTSATASTGMAITANALPTRDGLWRSSIPSMRFHRKRNRERRVHPILSNQGSSRRRRSTARRVSFPRARDSAVFNRTRSGR